MSSHTSLLLGLYSVLIRVITRQWGSVARGGKEVNQWGWQLQRKEGREKGRKEGRKEGSIGPGMGRLAILSANIVQQIDSL